MQNQLQTLARRIVYFRKSSVQAIRFASHVVVRTISYSTVPCNYLIKKTLL